jgi:hypothetical protein
MYIPNCLFLLLLSVSFVSCPKPPLTRPVFQNFPLCFLLRILVSDLKFKSQSIFRCAHVCACVSVCVCVCVFLKNISHRTTIWPSNPNYVCMYTHTQRKWNQYIKEASALTQMSLAELFTTAKTWNQAKSSSADEFIYINTYTTEFTHINMYTTECYSVLNKKKNSTSTTMWMNLENMLNEKKIPCGLLNMWNSNL